MLELIAHLMKNIRTIEAEDQCEALVKQAAATLCLGDSPRPLQLCDANLQVDLKPADSDEDADEQVDMASTYIQHVSLRHTP